MYVQHGGLDAKKALPDGWSHREGGEVMDTDIPNCKNSIPWPPQKRKSFLKGGRDFYAVFHRDRRFCGGYENRGCCGKDRMMEGKKMAKILCTVNDKGENFDVSIEYDGTWEQLLIAFSAIAKDLSENGIPTSLLARAFMTKDLLPGKTDKDSGAE